MRAIVAGGGLVGEQVARALQSAGHETVIVEQDRARAAELTAAGHRVVTGNACVSEVLEAAGALRADVLVACTPRDEENLLVCFVAKRHLELPRTVARVNDDTNLWLFDDAWGVDAALSWPAALAALVGEPAARVHRDLRP